MGRGFDTTWHTTHAADFLKHQADAMKKITATANEARLRWIGHRIKHHMSQGVGVSNINVRTRGLKTFITVCGHVRDELEITT